MDLGSTNLTVDEKDLNFMDYTDLPRAIPTPWSFCASFELFSVVKWGETVFSTWMTFGGNTCDLGSFGEEMDKITDLHQIHEEVLLTESGDSVAGIKRRHRDLSSDGVRDLVTASGRGRHKEDQESST
ncbi:hypothetical protein Tco_0516663 [Tanacetum coccineum]